MDERIGCLAAESGLACLAYAKLPGNAKHPSGLLVRMLEGSDVLCE